MLNDIVDIGDLISHWYINRYIRFIESKESDLL